MTKVCFTKSTVHVKRMVNFGMVGEREVNDDRSIAIRTRVMNRVLPVLSICYLLWL
jgi:hypothetical protein